MASINRHETYFGKKFAISAKDEIAETCCIAFGLERLTAYGLLNWGLKETDWPDELVIA